MKNEDSRAGLLFALSAYIIWGVLPIYMKTVAHIPPLEVVFHRILWSVPIAGVVLLVLGRTADIRRALRSPRMIAQGALAAAMVSVNWLIYVWAIFNDRTVEAALGYYINPLFSIMLAGLVLRERLARLQIVAIGFAVAAVALLTWHAGGLPWVAIVLPVTWGFYALLKKTLPIGATQGFFLEVLLLSVLALGYITWLEGSGSGHFFAGEAMDMVLLLLAGFATAIPLILYANGAKLLKLSTIGILQYTSPTIMFLLAIFVFREPFDMVRLFAFIMIWTALALYSWSMLSSHRAARASAPAARVS